MTPPSSPSADADRDERLDAAVADYFEVKTTTIVQRALRLLDHDELHDDDAVEQLGTDLVDALERRYDRTDEGWREATQALVHTELERQVRARRRSDADLEAELGP